MIPRGLYAITDENLIAADKLMEAVQAALQGGAVMIQYRAKQLSQDVRIQQAHGLRDLCQKFSAPLIINDDLDLALAVHAQGVHLGKDDGDITAARAQLGPESIIGVSCYNQLELAEQAAAQGADYVAFGSFYTSPTKPDAVRAEVNLLRQAKARLSLPVCAIGGITAANAGELIDAGADLLAVISEVFGAHDIQASARNFSQLFNQQSSADS